MALTKVPYTDYQTVVTAQNLNDIQDEIISTTGYTTSNTPAAVAAKSAVLANYVLAVGASAKVKFTYSNTAANPTLNINATGAKPIVQYGATPVGATPATSWSEGEVLEFVYDGTNYVIVGRGEPIQPEDVGVGTLANLDTTAQTDLVSAVNEVVGDVGDLSDTVDANAVLAKCLPISFSSFSSLPQTVSNANITSDMVVVESEIGTPSAMLSNWTWTTANGSVTISGTISGSTTLKLYLLPSR